MWGGRGPAAEAVTYAETALKLYSPIASAWLTVMLLGVVTLQGLNTPTWFTCSWEYYGFYYYLLLQKIIHKSLKNIHSFFWTENSIYFFSMKVIFDRCLDIHGYKLNVVMNSSTACTFLVDLCFIRHLQTAQTSLQRFQFLWKALLSKQS